MAYNRESRGIARDVIRLPARARTVREGEADDRR
jgi:hypothetical protein